MSKPVLVIVGRPNVGKSTLFNRITRSHTAIVEDVPGVTRDRNYMDAAWEGKAFVAVDTGGFYPRHDDNIFTQIKEQALFAIEEADVIIHLLDGLEGLNPFDADLAELLRASGKRVLWAVNKVDSDKRAHRALDFYSLGMEKLYTVSATTSYGLDDLMDDAVSGMPEGDDEPMDYPRVAIVGRPNVGKSTLVNSLLGKQRMLVSPVAGTTRDSVDSICSYYKRRYLLIDTAGIRRKDKFGYSIERFAMVRALRSIERADVVLVLIDASEGIVSDDQKIAGLVNEQYKSVLFIFNKWDLVEEPDETLKALTKKLQRKVFFYKDPPVLTTSGLSKKRITKVFDMIDTLMKERRKRVPTAELNRFAEGLQLPSHRGKRVRVYYITQYATEPPRFSLFVNIPEAFTAPHVRHIEAQLRERYGFTGTPIKINVRKRS